MKLSLTRTAQDIRSRTVLVVQGDKAFWFSVVDGKVVERYKEYIPDQSSGYQLHCPWLKHGDASHPCLVELILDTTLDEIDRVSVPSSRYVVINRYRQLITLARLRRDYDQSTLYKLPLDEQESVASIMHHAIPERWELWLLELQKSALVFHQVTTGSQLAAFWSRRWTEHTLLVMRVAGYERHMLVRRGAALFLRTVRDVASNGMSVVESEDSVQSPIDQTIEYLRGVVTLGADTIAVVSFCPAALPVVKNRGSSDVHRAPPLSNSDADETGSLGIDDEESVGVLITMLLDTSIELDIDVRSIDTVCDADTLSQTQITTRQDIEASIPPGKRSWPGMSGFSLVHAADRYRMLRRSGLRHIRALQPSVHHVNAAHRLATVWWISMVFFVLALTSLSAAIIYGLAGHRIISSNEVQQAAIKVAEDTIYLQTKNVTAQPRVAADSLLVADSLSGLSHVEPESLLEQIATVLTRLTDVELERMVWAAMASEESYETLTHSLDAVPYRQGDNLLANKNVVQIELSGYVSGKTLNNQQKALTEFVNELLKTSHVVQARVLEAPIDTALSSETTADTLGRYRVLLIMGEV